MLNVDASCSATCVDYGFVLRDHQGVVWKSSAGPLNMISSAKYRELMVVWHSFKLVQEFWESLMVVVTNCQSLEPSFQQINNNYSILGGLVESLKKKCFA